MGLMVSSLPLFPLNTVLFPGQLLPLHIFEPRYRQMIQECLPTGKPFGVVLIREGEEVGETAEPYDVGTTARIVQVEPLPDGRMNILCVGEARFRIRQTHADRPYLRGSVVLWPWAPADAAVVQPIVDDVRVRLMRYLGILAELTESRIEIKLPDEPAGLGNTAAAVLQIEPVEKQELLATASITELLQQIDRLLRREIRGLRILQASRPTSLDDASTFSLN